LRFLIKKTVENRKKIYEIDHYQNDWDGENCSDGVYYYIFKYETYFKEDEVHGTVTIIRE